MGGIGQGRPGEPESSSIWQDYELGRDLGELQEVVSRRGESDAIPAEIRGKCPYCDLTPEAATVEAASRRVLEKTFNRETKRVSWAWENPPRDMIYTGFKGVYEEAERLRVIHCSGDTLTVAETGRSKRKRAPRKRGGRAKTENSGYIDSGSGATHSPIAKEIL